MSLKEQIKKQFNIDNSYFDRHETDLYVLVFPELMNWLEENYRFHSNIQFFAGAKDTIWEGKLCIDIPFAA